MTGTELATALAEIGMTIESFANRFGYCQRTAKRWAVAAKVPGPVRAAALAWLQCHRHGVDYDNVAFIGGHRHDSHDWLRV